MLIHRQRHALIQIAQLRGSIPQASSIEGEHDVSVHVSKQNAKGLHVVSRQSEGFAIAILA